MNTDKKPHRSQHATFQEAASERNRLMRPFILKPSLWGNVSYQSPPVCATPCNIFTLRDSTTGRAEIIMTIYNDGPNEYSLGGWLPADG